MNVTPGQSSLFELVSPCCRLPLAELDAWLRRCVGCRRVFLARGGSGVELFGEVTGFASAENRRARKPHKSTWPSWSCRWP